MNTENTEIKNLAFKDYKTGIKIIWNEIKDKYKKGTYALIGISLLIAVGDGFMPLIAGNFYDSVNKVPGGELNDVFNAIKALALLIIITIATSLGNWWSQSKARIGWDKIFVSYLYDSAKKLLRLPMTFHNNNPMAQIDQKMMRSSNGIANTFSNVFLGLMPAFLSIGVALVAIFSVDIYLASIIIVGVIIYVYVLVRTVGTGANLEKESHERWIDTWHKRSDALHNLATVKQFAAEDYESRKIKDGYDKAFTAEMKLAVLWQKVTLWQKIIVITCQSLVLAIAILFAWQNKITIGQVIAINAYVGMMFGPFMSLGTMWKTIQNSIVSATDAHEVLSNEPEKYDNGNSLVKINGNVELKNIHFYHDERKKILNGISLGVAAGKKIALVGETGSGKTSLIELIYRFYTPQKGEILIDGTPLQDFDLKSLRSQIGVVPQEPVLFDTTIAKNIAYPNIDVPIEKLKEAARRAELIDFIEDQPDKWETIVGDRGVKLSGGQKQRVAIARAILSNPKILILDESTSALDAKTQKSIEAALDELMEGRTTFIVAHRLSAVRNADTICVLHKGKIIEQGSHAELMAKENGKYRQLYEIQFHEKELEDRESEVLST